MKDSLQHFFHVSLADSHPAGHVPHRGLRPRSKTARRHLGRPRGLGVRPTHQAGHGVALILGHFRFDARQFGHLMAHRLRVFTQQQYATRHTLDGPGHDHMVHLREGLERPPMPSVARLPTGFSPRGRRFRARRSIGRIGRRRFRRVARGLVDPLFQFGHALLEDRDRFEQGHHQLLHCQGCGGPISCRNPGRDLIFIHTTSITRFRPLGYRQTW